LTRGRIIRSRLGEIIMPANKLPEPFVDSAAVAAHIGMSSRTVAKKAREGRIPAHSLSGTIRRTWGFKLSEIDAFILEPRPGCSAKGR
jgi:hypothetical protein